MRTLKILIVLILLCFSPLNKTLFGDSKSELIKSLDALITYSKNMNFSGFGKSLEDALVNKMGLKFANESNEGGNKMLWYEGKSIVVGYTPATRGMFLFVTDEKEGSFRQKNILGGLTTASAASRSSGKGLPDLLITKDMFPPDMIDIKYFMARENTVKFAVSFYKDRPSSQDRFISDLAFDIVKYYPSIELKDLLLSRRFKPINENNFTYKHYTDGTEINVTKSGKFILITAENFNIEKFQKSFEFLQRKSSATDLIVPLLEQADKRYEFVQLGTKKTGSLAIRYDVRGEDVNIKLTNPRLLTGIRIVFRD